MPPIKRDNIISNITLLLGKILLFLLGILDLEFIIYKTEKPQEKTPFGHISICQVCYY